MPGRPLWAGTAEPWKASWRHEASCFVAVLQLQPVIIPVKLFILCILGLTNRFQKNRGIRRVELERFRLLSEFNDTIQGAMVRRLVNKASQERRRPLVKPSSVEEGSELEEILAQGQDVWIRAANTGARRSRSGFSNRGSHSRKRRLSGWNASIRSLSKDSKVLVSLARQSRFLDRRDSNRIILITSWRAPPVRNSPAPGSSF